ncbi:MAG: chalcone isomerase family protein [Desulfobacterales bacterium]|nr:chalcone isomerase family protein [Desulfobacterales bacterium]
MLKKVIIAMMVVLMMASVSMAREYKGIDIPETMVAGNDVLVLNGIGERSVFMQQVYVIGLYLMEAQTDAQAVLDADEPMAVKMHVTNAMFASSKRVMDALYKGFRNNMPKGDLTPIEGKVEKFNACFSDEISKHDVFDIKYVPNKGTTVYKNGALKDTIAGADFKENVFGIWIGETPCQKDMKTAMLAGDVSEKAIAMRSEKKAELEEQMMAQAEAKKAEAAGAKEEAEEAAAEAKSQAAAKAEKELAAKEKAVEEKAEKAAAKAEKEMAAKEKAVAEEAEEAAAAGAGAAATAAKAAEEIISKEKFVSSNIYFSLSSNSLSDAAKQKLDAKAAWLEANPDTEVVIEGHSDARGPKDLNHRLAKQRAQSVKDYLVNAGIGASRMAVKSYGEERPAVSGNNKAAWMKNRRVHLKIVE